LVRGFSLESTAIEIVLRTSSGTASDISNDSETTYLTVHRPLAKTIARGR